MKTGTPSANRFPQCGRSADRRPLYTFSGDTKAGDVNGKLVKSAPTTSTMMSASYGY